jgi:hypothetical protein
MYLFAVVSGTAEYLPLSPVALFGLPGRHLPHLPTDNAHVGATQGDETVETRNRWECGRSRRTSKERLREHRGKGIRVIGDQTCNKCKDYLVFSLCLLSKPSSQPVRRS